MDDQYTDIAPQSASRISKRDLAAKNVTSHNLAQGAVSGNVLGNVSALNTPSTIVQRDASGNFAAGTITASLTGKASQNESLLTFSSPLSRVGNTVGLSYTPVNKAGDTMGGNLVVPSVRVTSGGTLGTAVLIAGVVTVTTVSITANSIVLLTAQVPGGTPGALYVSSRNAGTSFVISSLSNTDTSTVGWLIVEPI